jgi:uncharacterized iron-regulated membrane protein
MAGLVIGLAWTLLGITGSLLVFIPELRRAEVPGMTRVAPTAQRLPLDQLLDVFTRARPKDRLMGIYCDFKPGWALDFRSTAPNGDQWHTFIDPYRAKVVGSLNYRHRLLQWILELHGNLLNGRPGRTFNGGFAASLAIMATLGLLLWWQGSRQWRRGLSYSRRRSWKRQAWDLHGLAGFLFSVPLLIISLTGVYYGFPDSTKSFFGFMTGGPAEILPPSLSSPVSARPPLESMMRHAQQAIPDSTLSIILFPRTPHDPFAYRMRRSSDLHRLGLNWVYLDPSGPRVLRVDRLADQPLSIQLWRVMAPFHYGHFYGWIPRIIWMLAGLVPGICFVTSLLMWWNRSLSKRRRIHTNQPAAAVPTHQI